VSCRIVKSRARTAGFDPAILGGHRLKRGAMTTGMDRSVHPTRLKQLGRHKTTPSSTPIRNSATPSRAICLPMSCDSRDPTLAT
jgi:hypothetical protein